MSQNEPIDPRISSAPTDELKQTLIDGLSLLPRHIAHAQGVKWATHPDNVQYFPRLALAIRQSGERPGSGDAADFAALIPLPITESVWNTLATNAGDWAAHDITGLPRGSFDEDGLPLDEEAPDGEVWKGSEATDRETILGFLQGVMEVWDLHEEHTS